MGREGYFAECRTPNAERWMLVSGFYIFTGAVDHVYKEKRETTPDRIGYPSKIFIYNNPSIPEGVFVCCCKIQYGWNGLQWGKRVTTEEKWVYSVQLKWFTARKVRHNWREVNLFFWPRRATTTTIMETVYNRAFAIFLNLCLFIEFNQSSWYSILKHWEVSNS